MHSQNFPAIAHSDARTSTIGTIGMSPNGSVYGQEFELLDGRTACAIQESPDTHCIQVGALAARYSMDELHAIGEGDEEVGKQVIVSQLVQRPEDFQFGCTKPAAQVEPGQQVIYGETVTRAITSS